MRHAALLFFALPALLFPVLRSKPVDNRPLAPAPHWRLSWRTLDEGAAWAGDRLPLRDRSIRANAALSQSLFGEAPSNGAAASSAAPGIGAPGTTAPPTTAAAPAAERDLIRLPPPPEEEQASSTGQVIVGRQGWLYYADELARECQRRQPLAQVTAGLARLQAILARSGRTFSFSVAPDKSTAVPGNLPATYPAQACSTRAKAEDFEALAAAHIPGYIDMRALVAERQAAEGRDYYLRKDTHWNDLAGVACARDAMSWLDPSMVASARVDESVGPYTGDLTRLLGRPATDQTIKAVLSRPGVVVSQQREDLGGGLFITHLRAATTSAPVRPRAAMLVGDSFSDAVAPALGAFFSDLQRVPNSMFARIPRTLLQRLATVDTVVVVFAERYLTDPSFGVLWSPDFLDKLEATLPPLR